MALYDDPTDPNSMQSILMRPYTMNQMIGGAQQPAAPAGPPPLTPAQLAFQQAQAGTPLPQGFNPSMIPGGMGGMPVPQGFGGAAVPTASTGGLSPTYGMGGLPAQGGAAQHTAMLGPGGAMGLMQAGQGLMQASQPHTAGAPAPSMLGGGGTIPQAQPQQGMSSQLMGMGAGMNPALLKMLMGAGNGTA